MFVSNHRHGRGDLAGYKVQATIVAGDRLGESGPFVAEWHAATDYVSALEYARSLRTIDAGRIVEWAVIRPVYADGCIGSAY